MFFFGKGLSLVADNQAYKAVLGFNGILLFSSYGSECVNPQSIFKDRHENCFDELRKPLRCLVTFEQKFNGLRRLCNLKTVFLSPTKISRSIYVMTYYKLLFRRL